MKFVWDLVGIVKVSPISKNNGIIKCLHHSFLQINFSKPCYHRLLLEVFVGGKRYN